MIIVSQDKNIVVNFENVANINIEKYYNASIKEEDFTFDIVAYMVSGELVRIGKYKTEERAKEVLQEIINKYREVKMICDINNKKYEVVDRPKVYETPEK